VKNLVYIGKFDPETIVSAVYLDGNKGRVMVKRFQIETNTPGQRFPFITEHKNSRLYFATADATPRIKYSFKVKSKKHEAELDVADFIEVKGWKALGNKLSEHKLLSVKDLNPAAPKVAPADKQAEKKEKKIPTAKNPEKKDSEEKPAPTKPLPGEKLHAGDTIDFDVEDNGQAKLF
jgi:topoisomerase IV subunit A